MEKLVCRKTAVEVAGEMAVDALDRVNCEMTCRVTDGGNHADCEEFRADKLVTVKDLDGEDVEVRLSAYWYVSKDELAVTDNLDEIDWDATFAGYDVSEFPRPIAGGAEK